MTLTHNEMVQSDINKLRDFRNIGEKFTYLGCEMVVKKHHHYEFNGYGSDLVAVLIAEYADKNGIIRRHEFNVSELPILKKENGDHS